MKLTLLSPGKRTSPYPDNYYFASIKTKNAVFDLSGETLSISFLPTKEVILPILRLPCIPNQLLSDPAYQGFLEFLE